MREITVSAISYEARTASVADAREEMCGLIRQAGCEKPDLIVMPEVFYGAARECCGVPGDCFAFAEPIDGPTVTKFAALAKEYRTYLTATLVLDRGGGKRTNSCVLLDRTGQVAGVYDKYHPTMGELQEGFQVTPGKGAVTIDTDFGRVGMMICYDLNFHELREQYLQCKADLLLFLSWFPGGMLARTWALLNHCYLVCACRDNDHAAYGSSVIDPLGRVLGQSAKPFAGILTRRINLDYMVMSLGGSHLRFKELAKCFGGRYTLDVAASEAYCLLTSNDPKCSVTQMGKELGLEDIESYLARGREARKEATQGKWLPLLPPEW